MIEFGIKDALDIFLVASLLFYVYRLMKESRSLNIFVGIMLFVLIWLFVSQVLEMRLLGSILDKLVSVGVIALIVIFQEDIRRFLYEIGSQKGMRRFVRFFRSNKDDAREVQQLRDLGAKDIILDPGFGFGKDLAQNYQIFAEMEKLNVMELPVLVGISRKSMIYKLLGGDATTSLNGTSVLDTVALMKGTSILRVHDVKEAVEAVRIVEAMNRKG